MKKVISINLFVTICGAPWPSWRNICCEQGHLCGRHQQWHDQQRQQGDDQLGRRRGIRRGRDSETEPLSYLTRTVEVGAVLGGGGAEVKVEELFMIPGEYKESDYYY